MHRTGVSSAGSTEDLIPDFISVKNPKDLGRNEPLLAFQRDYHSLQMKLNKNNPLLTLTNITPSKFCAGYLIDSLFQTIQVFYTDLLLAPSIRCSFNLQPPSDNLSIPIPMHTTYTIRRYMHLR